MSDEERDPTPSEPGRKASAEVASELLSQLGVLVADGHPEPQLAALLNDREEPATGSDASASASRSPAAMEAILAPRSPLAAGGEAEAQVTMTLGKIYLEQGHRQEAQRIFERIASEQPENAAARAALEELEPAPPVTEPVASEERIRRLRHYLAKIRSVR